MGTDYERTIGIPGRPSSEKVWQWNAPPWIHLIVIPLVLLCLTPAAAVLTLLATGGEVQNLSLEAIAVPWRYSLEMAALSSIVCVLIAPLVTCSLISISIDFSSPWLRLLALPYCLPSVAVGGMLVLAFGNAGFANKTLQYLHLIDDNVPILYQTWSPLLGTIWMNLSIGVMMLLNAWSKIPGYQWKQAELMKFSPWMKFRLIIAPYSFNTLLQWVGMVFFACFSSFGLMLMLSGSPRSTTLEVATWQALTYEGDWSKAALLVVAQFFTSILAALTLWLGLRKSAIIHSSSRLDSSKIVQFTSLSNLQTYAYKLTAGTIVLLFLLFYLLPPLALIFEVFQSPISIGPLWSSEVLPAMMVSGKNASVCALVAVIIVMLVIPVQQRAQYFGKSFLAGWLNLSVMLPTILPGMALSFALLAFAYRMESDTTKIIGVWAAQALMALPVAAAFYWSGWVSALSANYKIQDELGLSNWTLWRHVELPVMKLWLAVSALLAFTLSVSDSTIVSVLTDPTKPPLTLLIAQLMGSYRFGEASFTILVLVSFSVFVFLITANHVGDRRNA